MLSLNGADNVSKTTQIEGLPGHYTKGRGLNRNDKRILEKHQKGLLQDR